MLQTAGIFKEQAVKLESETEFVTFSTLWLGLDLIKTAQQLYSGDISEAGTLADGYIVSGPEQDGGLVVSTIDSQHEGPELECAA